MGKIKVIDISVVVVRNRRFHPFKLFKKQYYAWRTVIIIL